MSGVARYPMYGKCMANVWHIIIYIIYTLIYRYLVYSVGWQADGWSGKNRTRGQVMRVHELVWLDINAYRSIWSYIAKHDLVGEVNVMAVPEDDPAPLIFQEPRTFSRL